MGIHFEGAPTKVLDPVTKKLILSRDVMIDEKTDSDRRDSGASISDKEEIEDDYSEGPNEILAGPESPAEEEQLAESPAREEQPEPRRSKREKKPVEFFRPSAWYALAARDLEPEPQTLTAALSGNERDEWQKANR